MPRAIWKGAISFGLVHVPVALLPASDETGIDFDWLDKRSMDPVGYQRINKRTGKVIDKDDIVKGVKIDSGEYVLVSDEEIKAAYPKTTQSIEIEAFVSGADISMLQLEKPYYLEPLAKGEKVYALLREAMLDAKVVGIARVVMHTKEHLAALIPSAGALTLNTLRWATEIRSLEGIKLPAEGRKLLKDAELKMAAQLISDMTVEWKPESYDDHFTEAVKRFVAKRVSAGRTETVEPLETSSVSSSDNVIDLTALLAKSLSSRKPGTRHSSASAVTPIKRAKKLPSTRKQG